MQEGEQVEPQLWFPHSSNGASAQKGAVRRDASQSLLAAPQAYHLRGSTRRVLWSDPRTAREGTRNTSRARADPTPGRDGMFLWCFLLCVLWLIIFVQVKDDETASGRLQGSEEVMPDA